MADMIFPLITDFESSLPVYLADVGCNHIQDHVLRSNGYPFLQLMLCNNGSGELLVDGKKITISEKQAMLLYPNVPHEYYPVKEPWKVDWISIGGFASLQVFSNAGIKESSVIKISRPDVILLSIQKALYIAKSNNTMKGLEISKTIYDLIMDIFAYVHTDKDDFRMNQHDKLKPIFDYIENNFNKIITLQQLSEVSNLTPQYLCTIFKRITGIRVFEYINSVRVKKSKEMIISHKEMSIKDIAEMCGYDNVSYFCEVFKKTEKVTPGNFRKLYDV